MGPRWMVRSIEFRVKVLQKMNFETFPREFWESKMFIRVFWRWDGIGELLGKCHAAMHFPHVMWITANKGHEDRVNFKTSTAEMVSKKGGLIGSYGESMENLKGFGCWGTRIRCAQHVSCPCFCSFMFHGRRKASSTSCFWKIARKWKVCPRWQPKKNRYQRIKDMVQKYNGFEKLWVNISPSGHVQNIGKSDATITSTRCLSVTCHRHQFHFHCKFGLQEFDTRSALIRFGKNPSQKFTSAFSPSKEFRQEFCYQPNHHGIWNPRMKI